MIKEFVERFLANPITWTTHPSNYIDIIRKIVQVITTYEYSDIDPDRIHKIDDGEYQGTLVFVIGSKGYQPYDYWYTKVGYGSCSGCDTLQNINNYSNDPPTLEQQKEYNILALHIVQQLRKMHDENTGED